MIKLALLSILIIGAISFGACAAPSTPPAETPAPTTPTPTPTPAPSPTPSPTPTPTPTPGVTPVELSLLHVDGNRIKDENGNIVILRGVSIADPCFLDRVDHHFTEADLAELAREWRATVVRVPFHPDLWEQHLNYAASYLDPVVAWGEEYGLYILLGWHAHGNSITGEVEKASLRPQWLWHGNPYNPSLDLAISAWHEVAERYKDKSWVLYSIFNEPSHISWDEWRPVAEQLIDVVRSHNPRALILVSGVDWGYDLRGVADDPVQRDNIVYESHPYPPKPKPWDEWFSYLADSYPVFIGEWGFETGDEFPNLYATRHDYGEPLVNYMESKGMGWTAWCWHPKWPPRMLQDWSYKPTEFGQLIKEALLR